MINGNDEKKGMQAFMEAVYELEQMATQGDVYCDGIRAEVEVALKNGVGMSMELEERFYWAKAVAIQNFIRGITQ